MKLSRNTILTLVALVVVAGLLTLAQNFLNPYLLRILNLCAIFSIYAVTFNLVFGYTGQFSLGHAGFAAVGAYVAALLTLTPAQKISNFFLKPIVPLLANVEFPFLPALIVGGLLASLVGSLIAWPALRLRGDYLAIATLGFSEIIRILLVNMQPITNGALGLKGIPSFTNLFWSWGSLAVCLFVVKRLVDSSYGRAMRAVRDDEWGSYRKLYEYLNGHGVPDVREALRELTLQPVLGPLRELFNPGYFQFLSENRLTVAGQTLPEHLLPEAMGKLGSLLRGINDLNNLSGDLAPILAQLSIELEASLKLRLISERFPLPGLSLIHI